MSLPIFNTLPMNAKVSFVTMMQVGNVSRFKGFTYLGLQAFAVARAMTGQDPSALVMATRAYFRTGSETDPEKVVFVAVRQDNNSPIMLIPEPLIQANSVQVSTRTTHVIRVESEVSRAALSTILSSNGIERFTIDTEVI